MVVYTGRGKSAPVGGTTAGTAASRAGGCPATSATATGCPGSTEVVAAGAATAGNGTATAAAATTRTFFFSVNPAEHVFAFKSSKLIFVLGGENILRSAGICLFTEVPTAAASERLGLRLRILNQGLF